jgi:hypothetical protein
MQSGTSSGENRNLQRRHAWRLCVVVNSFIFKTFIGNKFGPQSKNIASIVRGSKSSVTKYSHFINPDFKLQERYHDHIIRNTESFERIQNYIAANPLNRKVDKFNT